IAASRKEMCSLAPKTSRSKVSAPITTAAKTAQSRGVASTCMPRVCYHAAHGHARSAPAMRTVWIASLVVAFTACKKEREPPSSASLLAPASGSPPAAAAAPPVSSTTPPALLPMGVTWEDPPGWERVGKSNPMRKATYRIPRAAGDGEDAELAVFYF